MLGVEMGEDLLVSLVHLVVEVQLPLEKEPATR